MRFQELTDIFLALTDAVILVAVPGTGSADAFSVLSRQAILS